MRVLLEQDHIDRVPEWWAKQYDNEYEYSASKKEITSKLNNLVKPLIKEEIDAIIGNDSWTSFKCAHCNKQSKKLIYIALQCYNSFEDATVSLCKPCLEIALKTIG